MASRLFKACRNSVGTAFTEPWRLVAETVTNVPSLSTERHCKGTREIESSIVDSLGIQTCRCLSLPSFRPLLKALLLLRS